MTRLLIPNLRAMSMVLKQPLRRAFLVPVLVLAVNLTGCTCRDWMTEGECLPGPRIENAKPSTEALGALAAADGIVFAPSNPFVSIEPVLALPIGGGAGGIVPSGKPRTIRDLVAGKAAIAVSPIVGGEAIKGPAAKMMLELGLDVSPVGVARRYAGTVSGFIMDEIDAARAPEVDALGLNVRTAQSIMRTDPDRESLARACLELVGNL